MATHNPLHFTAHVRARLQDWADREGYNLYTDGLRIHTTLDSKLQQLAEKIPAYAPIAQAVHKINEDIIQSAKKAKSFDPSLALKIDEGSHQIETNEAELIASIFSLNNLQQKNSKDNFGVLNFRLLTFFTTVY